MVPLMLAKLQTFPCGKNAIQSQFFTADFMPLR
jgi:hypothetical protein